VSHPHRNPSPGVAERFRMQVTGFNRVHALSTYPGGRPIRVVG
jgi:hypothetical protein